ncbi:MAG TPA: CBS domain-containing protein [Candidatus Dormibacteraeota bacterium]|jgi:signal-transduction protein with cAMP-binding, CBS, and nucleotidyltransferase domain
MAQSVRELMTPQPVLLQDSASAIDAARSMRDQNIGDVIVVKNGEICGVVTDRDIVVRVIADGRDPASVTLGEICSTDVATVEADENVDTVEKMMREKAIRRVPVVESGRPVGVISLGDLVMQRDKKSALADISEAPPNN